MAPVRNASVVLTKRPQGEDLATIAGSTTYSTSEIIDLENLTLEKGQVLLKTLAVSIDPYIAWLMAGLIDHSPYEIGKTIYAHGIAQVIRSADENIKPGDHLEGFPTAFSEYDVKPPAQGHFRLVKNRYNLPWSLFVGILGMPGQTAYFGWMEYAQPEKGQTVFISSGAGIIGSLIIQLAKILQPELGLKVIASAGSDEKVEWMKSIGADVAFNYKTESTAEVLKREGPIDIYWDSVGGETLDAALENAAHYARVIICGQISALRDGVPVKKLARTIERMITIYGLEVLNPKLISKWGSSFEDVFPRLVKEGKIQCKEDRQVGLDKVEAALVDQLYGRIIGKTIIVVNRE